MTISQLINELQKLQDLHGDLEVKAPLTPSTLYQVDRSVLSIEVTEKYIKLGN